MTRQKMILIAGPYRSGTANDPQRMIANLRRLEDAALAVYRMGHMPMIGEWVALPLAKVAGSRLVGDTISEEFLYPVASRLLNHCNAVLRLQGESKGADEDVRIALELGLEVYKDINDIPSIFE